MRPFMKSSIVLGAIAILAACGTPPQQAPRAEVSRDGEAGYQLQQLSSSYLRRIYRRVAANQARYILQEVNALRTANGLPALTLDSSMSGTASAHSADMSTRNYSAHTSPDGTTPDSRMRAAGIAFNSWGENIGYQSGGGTPATRMMDFWKNSAGHRGNMLNANFKRIGVGVVRRSSDGYWYYTTVFAD